MIAINERWVSPLQHRQPLSGEGVSLQENPWLDGLCLRGQRDELNAAAMEVIGLELPAKVSASSVSETLKIFALSPDEWIIFSQQISGSYLLVSLSERLAEVHHQVTDISDFYTAIDVCGRNSREVLSRLLVIDLHPRELHEGCLVATVAARLPLWVEYVSDGEGEGEGEPIFRLHIRRSHADHLWCLLADAARAYGVPAQEPVGRVRLHLPHFAP